MGITQITTRTKRIAVGAAFVALTALAMVGMSAGKVTYSDLAQGSGGGAGKVSFQEAAQGTGKVSQSDSSLAFGMK